MKAPIDIRAGDLLNIQYSSGEPRIVSVKRDDITIWRESGMSSRNGNIQHMLSELESLGHGLTAWEQQFLETVMDQWDRTRRLTDDQVAKLTEIYGARVK